MTAHFPPNRRGRRWFGSLAVLSAMVTIPGPARAQESSAARAGASRQRSPVVVTAASAILPGSGQLLLGQRRGVAYLAVEAAGLAYYISQTRDGRRERDRYREISRAVARAPFSPGGPQGDWDYYERMEKFEASGAFDAVAGGEVDPETVEETYNGSVWLLARQTYWRDPENPPAPSSPEYRAALDFYLERAVSPEMRWSWTGSPEAFQRFKSAIKSSNSAFRQAGHTASLVLANHFLSAVDAYVSVRIRAHRSADGSLSATATIPLPSLSRSSRSR